jgi:hypothetical protein
MDAGARRDICIRINYRIHAVPGNVRMTVLDALHEKGVHHGFVQRIDRFTVIATVVVPHRQVRAGVDYRGITEFMFNTYGVPATDISLDEADSEFAHLLGQRFQLIRREGNNRAVSEEDVGGRNWEVETASSIHDPD